MKGYSLTKENITNYAYNGYYITETRNGFVVESPKLGRAKIHTGKSLVSAKQFIDDIDKPQEKAFKHDYMGAFLASMDKAIEATK